MSVVSEVNECCCEWGKEIPLQAEQTTLINRTTNFKHNNYGLDNS